MEGKLFAFGGYDGASRLCTVECYDPKVCVRHVLTKFWIHLLV